MTLPDPEAFRMEMDRAMADLKALTPEPVTSWQKGIAQHPWALITLTSMLLVACGALLGRTTDNESRERAAILKTLDEQRKWNEWIQSRVSTVETGLARYGDDVGRVNWIVEEMRKDQLNLLRAAANARGDDRTVAKIDKKLQALAASKTGGQ